MRLAVAGIGPGAYEQMTRAVTDRLERAEAVVGYRPYIDQIRCYFPGKDWRPSGMRDEEARCALAAALAMEGRDTVLVCGGDPGIYALAGLLLGTVERSARERGLDPAAQVAGVEVLPGISAHQAGAALLGAPLVHDYASISLSTSLTDWSLIERRIRAAAAADFCIVFYNPASRQRPDTLARAARVLLEELPGDRICGIAWQIGRTGERWRLCTLASLGAEPATMASTVFVGNSRTRSLWGRMVTPRGYGSELR